MPKKPLIIILIALCYFLAPFFIIFQASMITYYPLIGPNNIFLKFSVFDWLILSMYILGALSVFSVKKWGWFLFISASAVLIISNILVFSMRPYYSVGSLILYNLVFTIAAGILFRKTLIAPYFNPQIRWWTQTPRYKIDCYVEIGYIPETLTAEIVDISETGIYIVSQNKISPHAPLPMCIFCADFRILVDAKIVRTNPVDEGSKESGYGLKFIHVPALEKKALTALIKRLKQARITDTERFIFNEAAESRKTSSRFVIQTTALLQTNGTPHPVKLADISSDGCQLQLPSDYSVSMQSTVHITFSCFSHIAEVKGTVRWIRRNQDSLLIGISYKKHHETINTIIAAGKKAGAKNRLKTARPIAGEQLTEYALNSPYKIVHAIKTKLIKKNKFSINHK